MHFSLSQIAAIIFPLIVAFVIILFWLRQDRKTKFEKNREKFITLISVFFWSAFGGLLLKLFLDTVFQFDANQIIFGTMGFYLFSILLEEIIKDGSLVIGLELTESRFNEVSDGIIYGAMSALGFLFFENIFYLLETTNQLDFWFVLSGRYFVSFGIHLLTTIIFGLTYARAYLGYKKRLGIFRRKLKKTSKQMPLPSPFAILYHFKSILVGNPVLNIVKFFIGWNLLQRFYLIVFKHKEPVFDKKTYLVFPSLYIAEGFLLGYYLHLIFNYLLQHQLFDWIMITLFPTIIFLIYVGFGKLSEKN